jgi:hypothetical protein
MKTLLLKPNCKEISYNAPKTYEVFIICILYEIWDIITTFHLPSVPSNDFFQLFGNSLH